MPEINKDQNIRLFGRTISLPRNNTNDSSSEHALSVLPEDHNHPPSPSSPREVISAKEHEAENDKEPSTKVLVSDDDDDDDDEGTLQNKEDLKSPASSSIYENSKTPSAERESSLVKASKNGEQSETSVSQDKTPKKPDKILPCPRCNSMDTKFCYYNNYNVNQPRHFCKKCQRYWTAGGTMRNVPVGAGRRKNKNSLSSASHYHQIMIPEALQTAKLNGLHNGLLGNGAAAVLTFGSDSPLSDSMASVLSLAEKTQNGVVLNGFHAPKQNVFAPYNKIESNNNNVDDNSVAASVVASTSSEKKGHGGGSHESMDKSFQVFPPQLPCFQGSSSPWPYPWNPTMPPPLFCQPGYPMSFYPPPAYWGVNVMPPPSWSAHPISPNSHSTAISSPNSLTLGKHSRDGNILSPTSLKEKPSTETSSDNNNSENSVLIPKTLRIDDPGEAAKSSIWSTLGIKNDNGGIFKAFPSSKGSGDKNHVVEASPLLHANPAALSRSLIFHERT